MYYLQTRYYDPQIGQFISPDSPEYLDPETINGLSLYAYCNYNPVMNVDPTGQFVITLSTILIGALIGAGIGAMLSFGATMVADYMDDGQIFNGSISGRAYLGNTLGGFIAGAGVGLSTVLGAGIGVALAMGEALTISGITISAGTAVSIGLGSAFVSGGLGYLTRVGISDQEDFNLNNLYLESLTNAASGLLSFIGGLQGGNLGYKTPGAVFSIKNFLNYQKILFQTTLPVKLFLVFIKLFQRNR